MKLANNSTEQLRPATGQGKHKKHARRTPRPIPGFDAPTSAAIRHVTRVAAWPVKHLLKLIRRGQVRAKGREAA